VLRRLAGVSEVEAISGRERKREPAAEILSEAKDLLCEAEVGGSDRQSALMARAIAWTVNSVSLRPTTHQGSMHQRRRAPALR